MVKNLGDRSGWSFGLARELPGPVPEFSVASFVANAAALSILVNGSSSVIQGDILIGTTWSQIQRLLVSQWFDRMENCVGLSRGHLDGPGKVESLAFPGSLLRALRQELGREGSYANALLALLIREGGSTSEHREGALRGGSCFPRIPGSHCF